MSREYKNKLILTKEKIGKEQRIELAGQPLEDSKILPDPLLIENYDEAFKKWVENKLEIEFDGKEIPTISLFAMQRFSEYMQSWKNVDDKRNFLMNFKVITRETNPKAGTMYGTQRNIPGDRFYSIQKIDSIDDNGRRRVMDYQMKQPYCIDIIYKLSIVSNKLRLINKFNEMLNDEFKSIDSYLNVEGHMIPMTLGEIGDDSEYQIDDRQFYSQSYQITVKGYLIREEDMRIIERPIPKLRCLERGLHSRTESFAEIEEYGKVPEYDYEKVAITMEIGRCADKFSFTCDSIIIIDKIEMSNLKRMILKVNDETVYEYYSIEGQKEIYLKLRPGDVVSAERMLKINYTENELGSNDADAKIVLTGYYPDKPVK